MVTLSLFRHAKSSWASALLKDFERPLSPRGEASAPRMGRYMAAHAHVPDLIVCSPAKRTEQTLALASAEFGAEPVVRFEEALYHAAPRQLFELVQGLPGGSAHAMLIGHNPGLHYLACELSGTGDEAQLSALGSKFPTAALAVISFEGSWRDIAAGHGHLVDFMVPKRLPDD